MQIDPRLGKWFPVIVDAIKEINMRPKEPQNSDAHDLFSSRLDQIVDMNHPLAKLAATLYNSDSEYGGMGVS